MIVYDRRLSAWELELLAEWVRLKHKLRVNLIPNPSFMQEMSGFDCLLNVKTLHLESNAALILYHRFFGATTGYYVPRNAGELLKVIPVGNRALGVSVTRETRVWSQPHQLDAYVNHRFELEFYQDGYQPCELMLTYDSVVLEPKIVTLAAGRQRYQWDFQAKPKKADLSILIRPQGSLGRAAIGSLQLYRHHID